tara:strand:+ start:15306 stop:16052 length:747 start_codon:yes stop_codon:yes gene_type:complete
MLDQDDLQNIIEEIKAFPQNQLKKCEMPIGIYIHEIDGLHTRASIDLPQLIAAGMPPELIDKMLARTNGLRTAQCNWEEQSTQRQQAIKIWKTESPAIYALRADLIENMTFAYRNNADLLRKLKAIKKGNSHADAVQDLANLALLGRANSSPLQAIHFDITLCDKASEEATKMGRLLGQVGGQMYVDDELKVFRDKAFSLLKEAVDEVRSYGRFVFRKNSDLQKSYTSKYIRERNHKYRKKQKNLIEN